MSKCFLRFIPLSLMLVANLGFCSPSFANEGSAPKKPTAQEQPAQPAKVNINTATQNELETLPQIGPKIAQRILEFRKEHGNFKSLEELMNVKGIGEKTYAKMKDRIKI